jgi:hypothetical protein
MQRWRDFGKLLKLAPEFSKRKLFIARPHPREHMIHLFEKERQIEKEKEREEKPELRVSSIFIAARAHPRGR